MSEASVQSYKDLLIWQRSMGLVEACYRLSTSFPVDERFGLTAQLRRAAVSIPANIAEGFGRESTGAFVQFLRTAQGSLKEVETHLMIVERLQMANAIDVGPLLGECDEIGRMMRAFIRSVQRE